MDNKVLNELEKYAGIANPAISSMLNLNMAIDTATKVIGSIDIDKLVKDEFILKKPIINKTPKIYATIENES